MSEKTVAALAAAVGFALHPERREPVYKLLETLITDGAGARPEEVSCFEPAYRFEPRWPS